MALPARAQQNPAPAATRFEFRAPAGCSSAEDFATRVSKRSSRIRLVSDATVRRSLLVEVQQAVSGGPLRGTVTVVEADGTTRTRRLKAATCAEAVEGLALIATVTLDPDALVGEPAPEAPAPVEPKPEVKPPPVKPPAVKAPAPAPRRPSRGEPYRLSLGLAGSVLLNTAPEPALGGSASLGVELSPGRVLSSLLRLSVTHVQRRGISEQAGEAAFAFTLPTLDICPVRVGPRAFGLRPCGYGSVGLLEVWGRGTRLDESHVRPFAAAGLALWAGWRISEAFEIIADGRAGLALTRDEFAFDRGVFFKTPTTGFSAALGAAGGFP